MIFLEEFLVFKIVLSKQLIELSNVLRRSKVEFIGLDLINSDSKSGFNEEHSNYHLITQLSNFSPIGILNILNNPFLIEKEPF